jgi:hypothetical protein
MSGDSVYGPSIKVDDMGEQENNFLFEVLFFGVQNVADIW